MPVLRAFSEGGGVSGGDASEGGANSKQEELPVGSAVKARFKDTNNWRLGKVEKVHTDGKLDVKYADGVHVEKNVPVERVRGVREQWVQHIVCCGAIT